MPIPGSSRRSAPRCPGRAGKGAGAHYARNLSTQVAKSAQPWVLTLLRTVFAQTDPVEVSAQFDRVVEALEAKFPRAAAHLAEAREDLLAFTAFPREVWRQVWSNNPLSVNRPWDDTLPAAA